MRCNIVAQLKPQNAKCYEYMSFNYKIYPYKDRKEMREPLKLFD